MTDTPENKLPQDVQQAWQAYQEMSVSKAAYFDQLQAIDEKYREGGEPTIAENLQLEKLLKLHDKNVRIFTDAMQAIEDNDSRELLIRMLTGDSSRAGSH